jgi:hypothetical protein
MLQQNGYFALRFLAQDAGKRLDHILDTVLATLSRPTVGSRVTAAYPPLSSSSFVVVLVLDLLIAIRRRGRHA